MKVEALNCPNCGAGVASDRTQCEFCKTRLKTIACSSCLGLVFAGSLFCGHCGAKAIDVDTSSGDGNGECPRCKIVLGRLQIDNIELNECSRCGGMWAGVETFESICSDGEDQAAVLGFIGKRQYSAETLEKVTYVPCPDCKQLMNRSNFARASGVIIDICKHHGVWFDAGELPKIIQFIQKGGMQIAREKEKIDINDQRQRLKDEQRRQAAMDQRYGVGGTRDSRDSIGILSFIRSLFD
jgi:Zn-finger nucleic acid-binding protein